MKFNKIIVLNSETKDTVYTYLKRNGFSENYLRNLRKKEGYIKLNGVTAYTNALVHNNDLLELYQNPNTTSSVMQNTIPLDIVYEDDDILVVNKPSGIPTTPSRSHPQDNLSSAVLAYMFSKDEDFIVRVVNRLDKETAGLVCIAKHSLISNLLNSNNYITKIYYAICRGKISEKLTIDKKIDTTLNEYGFNNHRRVISELGKPATTFVTPVLFDGENTLCKFELVHGRTHQIRVHISSIDHPLLGDTLYGEASKKIAHTALVCAQMSIYNPIIKKQIILKIDLPNDFRDAFNQEIKLD